MSIELGIIEERNLKKVQDNFLSSSIGKIINNAVDIGLRSILPDLIEEEIIKIKDSFLENGFSSGIEEAIKIGLDFGKSAIGIFTGEFENINQIETVIKKGGIIDSVSKVLDFTIKQVNEKGLIDNSIAKIIKSGKNSILETIENNIEKSIETQLENVEKLEKYCNKWNESYEKKDFSQMEKDYKNIEKYIDKIIPLENLLKEARKIENIHNLIKNNGKNFDINEYEKILAEKLVN